MTRKKSKQLLLIECFVEAAKRVPGADEYSLVEEAAFLYHFFNIGGQRKPLKRRCHAWSNARRDFNLTPEEEKAEIAKLLEMPLKSLLLE